MILNRIPPPPIPQKKPSYIATFKLVKKATPTLPALS